jgi:hypothetical protein
MGNAGGAARDAERYRLGYPGQEAEEDPRAAQNEEFYANQRRCQPDRMLIDDLHAQWFGQSARLERGHGFIQWLFPIREPGMNYQAAPLTLREATAMREQPAVRQRLLKSYELMLDFYGMRLADAETGEVGRREAGHAAGYDNLNHSSHNYLRITRVLKCLGELGLARLQAPWCRFLVREVLDREGGGGLLPNCADSLENYWVPVVKDEAAREGLLRQIDILIRGGGGGGGGGVGASERTLPPVLQAVEKPRDAVRSEGGAAGAEQDDNAKDWSDADDDK